ncbi:hypothetical protein D3C84_1146850 [compost metagenome]
MIEVVYNALQVAAEKIARGRFTAPRLDAERINGRIAIGETFRKQLIEHGVLHPCRRLEQVCRIHVWVVEKGK